MAFAVAATGAARGDWREAPDFRQASQAIEQSLAESLGDRDAARAVSQWREAVAAAPSASRLGAPLRRLASHAPPRFGEALTELGDQPPAWLTTDEPAGPSLRLAAAEALSLERRHDACTAWLDGVDAAATYSPLLCEYLRLVAFRQTVDDQQAKQTLARLDALTSREGSATDSFESLGPARRWVVETLRSELAKQDQPLPTITRQMRDIERRLAQLGAGDATQERQQQVLDALDDLIEDLEEQKKRQQQQAASASPGQGGPLEPAEESRPGELKGSGEVDRKRLVSGDAWGALPPAERERLTQEITRDFPPRYRALIEDYYRTLAAPPDEPAEPARP